MGCRGWLPLAGVLLSPPALAWETDQLTRRAEPLPDLTAQANAELDRHLAAAIAWTNARTACAASPERTHRLLARDLHRRVGHKARPADRGWPRNQGYNVYGAWLEQRPEVRSHPDRDDLFGDLGLWQSPVLHLAGTCSTVGLAGQQVGVDKADHFLGMGWTYFRRSRWGQDEERAVALGTWTERSIFGMKTSLAFSYADLQANLDGYRFYAGLLAPGGEVARDAEGCLVQARPFDWAEHIDARYDELLNPSTYSRAAARGVQRVLDARGEAVCAELERAEGVQAVLAAQRAHADPGPTVAGRTPPRVDPFELERRCGAAR